MAKESHLQRHYDLTFRKLTLVPLSEGSCLAWREWLWVKDGSVWRCLKYFHLMPSDVVESALFVRGRVHCEKLSIES